MFFWIVLVLSFLTGLYGLITGQMVIFIPYTFLNPSVMWLVSQSAKLPALKSFIAAGWQNHMETIASLLLFLNIPGSVYLHRIGFQYDMALHAFGYWLLYVALVVLYPTYFYATTKKQISVANVLTACFFLAIVVGLAGEGVQKTSDLLFDTHLFFDVKQPIRIDFWTDILMNLFGISLGTLYAWKFMRLRDYFSKEVLKPSN